jgi:hypothetical protein
MIDLIAVKDPSVREIYDIKRTATPPTNLQSGLWGSDADGGGPTPSSAPLHLFTSSTDIGALVLRL